MPGYIRCDTSYWWGIDEFYLIPTITFHKWAKGIEITFYFLCLTIYFVISYIPEDEYES